MLHLLSSYLFLELFTHFALSSTDLPVKQCISLVGLHPFRPPPSPYRRGGGFSFPMGPMAFTQSLVRLTLLRYLKLRSIIAKQQLMQFEQVSFLKSATDNGFLILNVVVSIRILQYVNVCVQVQVSL